jgi:hypothetical protein
MYSNCVLAVNVLYCFRVTEGIGCPVTVYVLYIPAYSENACRVLTEAGAFEGGKVSFLCRAFFLRG